MSNSSRSSRGLGSFLANNPIVVILGLVGAIITIVVFVSGNSSLAEFVNSATSNYQDNPEDVAREFVNACLFDDYEYALSLMSPGARNVGVPCKDLGIAKIERVVTREETLLGTQVSFIGSFYFDYYPDIERTSIEVYLEQLDGEWYVTWMP